MAVGTPVFLPGKVYGQRSLGGHSSCSCKESDVRTGTRSVNKADVDAGSLVVMSGQQLTKTEAKHWGRIFRIPLTDGNLKVRQETWARENQENKKSIQKLQYFGHLMHRVDSLEKTLMLGGIGGRRRRGRPRMRWLDGITDSMDVESERTPGVGDGQGGLVCCDSWGRNQLDTTERLT